MKPIMTLSFLLTLAVAGGGHAMARQVETGNTSGPAAGTPVLPSTAVQKENPFIAQSILAGCPGGGAQTTSRASGTSAGAPGIEGAPDTQSGR